MPKEALHSDGMRAAFRPPGEKEEQVEAAPDDEVTEGTAPPMPDAALQREQRG